MCQCGLIAESHAILRLADIPSLLQHKMPFSKQLVHRVLPVDPFFMDGWGNLEAVHWETDKKFFSADPPELQVWLDDQLINPASRGSERVSCSCLKGHHILYQTCDALSCTVFLTCHGKFLWRMIPFCTVFIWLRSSGKKLARDTSTMSHLRNSR